MYYYYRRAPKNGPPMNGQAIISPFFKNGLGRNVMYNMNMMYTQMHKCACKTVPSNKNETAVFAKNENGLG